MKWPPLVVTILSTVLLAGCGGKIVYVPVSSCPEPPPLAMPLLSVERLPTPPRGARPTAEQTRAAIRALGLDHVTLKKTLEQCILTLDAYRPPTPAP